MSLASVWMMNTLSMSGYVSVVEFIMSCLMVLNDFSCTSVHSKGFVFCRSFVRGSAFLACRNMVGLSLTCSQSVWAMCFQDVRFCLGGRINVKVQNLFGMRKILLLC